MTIHCKADSLVASAKLLLIFFICIITAQGQDASPACHDIDIGDYAKLSFCLSPEVSVVPGTLAEGNYSRGEDITKDLLLNGSKVNLHLLYPCEISGGLMPADLRSEANAFDPEMALASYNATPINISGIRALWGTLENMTFAIYMPSNRIVAIIIFDKGMPYQVETGFLKSLKIEMGSKSPQKYCAQSGAEPSLAQNSRSFGIFNNSLQEEFGPDMEAMLTGHEISQEALMADEQVNKDLTEAEIA